MITCHKHTLANGLRVVSVPMPHLHHVEMVCYVGVGSRHESDATAGISHFLEHMLFRGSEVFASSLEVERAFEEIGGAVNAATDAETTCYHSRLRPEYLARGAELFAELLRRPHWNEIETERRIILEEALDDLNEQGELINPDVLTNRLFWPDHPLSRPIIGDAESLQRIDRAALETHHRSYYTPGNTVIAVVGRLDPQQAVAAVETAFGDWAAAPPPPVPVAAGLLEQGPPQLVWAEDSSSQLVVQLAWQVPGRDAACALPLRLWRRILSWGGTSRLMQQLRENLGLTYNVEANLNFYRECGCLSVDLAVHPDNLLESVREALKIMAEMRSQPVPEEELERVKRNFRFDLDYSLDHTDDQAVRYGWGELVGYLRDMEQDRAEVERIDSALLQSTACELLLPHRLRAAVVGPLHPEQQQELERMLGQWPG